MTVLNKHVHGVPPGAVYIGRGSRWGNPFAIGTHGDRTQVLALYEGYAAKKLLEDPDWLLPLRGKDLVCFCAPRPCHGDILLRMMAA